MLKDTTYHTSAVEYNEGLADAADGLAATVPHPEIQKWCRAVSKQHRFHAKRHKSALTKLEQDQDRDDRTDAVNVIEPEDIESFNMSLAEQQAQYAKKQENDTAIGESTHVVANRTEKNEEQA